MYVAIVTVIIEIIMEMIVMLYIVMLYIYIYIYVYIYIYITNYLQTKSCAMGTICAPYINIFMDHFGKQLIYPFIIYPFTSILYCLALTNKRIFSKTTDFEYHLQELRERLVNQGLDEQFSKSQNDRQK